MSLISTLLAPVKAAKSGAGYMGEQASTFAASTDQVFDVILWGSVVAFVIIIGATVLFMVKYRRRSSNQKTSPIEGNHRLEIAWTIVPAVFFVVIFVMGFNGWMKMNVPPAGAIEVRVVGQKWSWSFSYPKLNVDGTAHLVVPENRPVKLIMSSEDVLHSFYIPAFRIKRDVLPNRYTVLWFEANKRGEYDIFCTEYCGDGHSRMIGRVKVVSAKAFQKWIDDGGGMGGSPLEIGKKLFAAKGCVGCHSTNADRKGLPGPPLGKAYGKMEQLADGSKVKIDDNYIRESILKPNAKVVKGYQPVMPTFAGQLKEKQINALITYIKSFK